MTLNATQTAPVAVGDSKIDYADPETPAPAPSLTRLALTGSAWTVIGYGGSQVLRLAGNIVVSRLLFPEAFGLMALVMTFYIGLEMFSDLGFGPSIIRSRDGERPGYLNTAWTMQAVRGVILWLACCAIAWPAAWFYGEPDLRLLLPAAGFLSVIGGLNSTSLFTLTRRLHYRTATLIELATQATTTVAMITFAVWHPSVWALVVGSLIGVTVRLVLSHLVRGETRNRFHWEPGVARELFHFGKWILLSTLLTFAVGQSDRLVFGKLADFRWLGLYGIALALAAMPSTVLMKIAASVSFPAYSRVHEQGGDLVAAFRRSRRPLLAVGGMMVTCMVVAGPAAVAMLYDPRYHDAGLILQLVSLGVWFQVLECTNGAVLLAVGDPRMVAIGNAAKLVTMLVGIPLGYFAWGIHGAIVGLGLADAARYAVSAFAVRRRGKGDLLTDFFMTALVVGTSAASIALLSLLPTHLPAERFTRFGLSVLPPILFWSIPAIAVLWQLPAVRDRIRSKLARR